MEKDVKNWLDLSRYDLKTAEAMFASRRYLYVLFTCQQAVEKMLKGMVVKRTQQFPPKTHNLIKLAKLATIELDEKQSEFLEKLAFYYLQTRYPEGIRAISKGHLGKWPFRPISALCSKFNPRNIKHMPAVKFFACLDLERKFSFFKAPLIYQIRPLIFFMLPPKKRLDKCFMRLYYCSTIVCSVV